MAASGSNSYPKTALFSEFIGHFQNCGREIGTAVGRRNSRFFKKPQFEKLFPGCAFEEKVAKGTLYCIRKRGAAFSDDGTRSSEKLKCTWSIPFKFHMGEMAYVVLDRAPSYCPDHSHAVNRPTIRASTRRPAQLDDLEPPWRLQRHPLFRLALQRIGVSPLPMISTSPTAHRPSETNTFESRQQIVVPDERLMYHHLMQRAIEVVHAGTKSVAAYKRTMMAFNNMLAAGNEVVDIQPGAGILAPIPRKQAQRRGRASNDELFNRSASKRVRRETSAGRACKTCRLNGVIAKDHRTGSKCPFFKQDC